MKVDVEMSRIGLLGNRLRNKPVPWHENKYYRELYELLSTNSNWDNDKGPEKNETARLALIKVLALCRKVKPDKAYEAHGYFGHLAYLQNLLNVRKALIDGLYMRACNELLDVVYLQPFSQARILNNVISLLSEFL